MTDTNGAIVYVELLIWEKNLDLYPNQHSSFLDVVRAITAEVLAARAALSAGPEPHTEWNISKEGKQRPIYLDPLSEAEARDALASYPPRYQLIRRTVGPWEVVVDV